MGSILVVDDDKAVQEMLKDLLIRAGHEVFTCRDGKQVIPELAKRKHDLMILDVLIPHMNGFVLMDQIRADIGLRELPVIMISGIYRSRNHRVDMTTRYNVIDYLDKPLSTDRLLDLVGRVICVGPETASLPAIAPSVGDLDHALAGLIPESPKQDSHATPISLDKPKPQPVPLTKPKSTPPEPDANHASVSASDVDDSDAFDQEIEELRRPIVSARAIKVEDRLVDTKAKDERQEVERAAKHSFKKTAFLIQGSIGKLPVPHILGKLWRERASGGLLLRREQIKKIVFLEKGNPFLVKSNLVSECLGQILLRERLINKEQCEQSVATMKNTGQRQGEVLVQMGVLTPKNLSFALELQLETKLFETFTWKSGEYRFNESFDLPRSDNELSWTGPTVVIDGIRRTFTDERLDELFEDLLDRRLEFGDEKIDAVAAAFSEKEQQAIANLKLPRSTAQLLGKIGLTTLDAMRLVYTLLTLGIVRVEE